MKGDEFSGCAMMIYIETNKEHLFMEKIITAKRKIC